MKRILLIIIIAIAGQAGLLAQTSEVANRIIYLKDGSKVIAQIVEVAEGEHITLKLTGGEMMRIYYENIKKITNIASTRKKPGLSRVKGEMVMLKDGSRLFGKIIRYEPNDFIILELKSGKEITFFNDEIQFIKYNKKEKKPLFVSTKGFYNETDIGVILGSEFADARNIGNFSIHTINGYRFSPLIHVGGGVGLDFQPGLHIVPFYLNVGGEFGKSTVVPIYFANVGYSYAEGRHEINDFIDRIEGGKYIHVGGGLKFKLHNYALQVKLGYKSSEVLLQDNVIDWSGRDGGNVLTKRKIKRFAATVGISF